MSSGLGIISEHIQYASYAGAIGMVVFAPFMQRVLAVRRPKMMLMTGFILLFWLSYIVQLQTVGYYSCYAVSLRVYPHARTLINLFALILYAFKIRPATSSPRSRSHRSRSCRQERSSQRPHTTYHLSLFRLFAQAGNSLTAWLAYEYEWPMSITI